MASISQLLRQRRKRWRELTPELEQQVRSLSADQLDQLAEALLEFRGLDDLTRWLQRL